MRSRISQNKALAEGIVRVRVLDVPQIIYYLTHRADAGVKPDKVKALKAELADWEQEVSAGVKLRA